MNNFKLTDLPITETPNFVTSKGQISQNSLIKEKIRLKGRICVETIINKDNSIIQYEGGYFCRIDPKIIYCIHPSAKFAFLKLHLSFSNCSKNTGWVSLIWW